MKQVKKRSKKENLYLSIYDLIKQGKSPKDICFDLQFSKQKLQYYLNYLKDKGLIKRIGYGVWEVKEEVKKSWLETTIDRPLTNLHALTIKFPILTGKIHDKDWQIKEKLKNWIPKYKEDLNLGGLIIKNNNNKSITVFAKSRDIENLDEVYNLAFKIKTYIYDYFKKDNIILDVFNCETKNINLATEDKKARSMVRKGERFELDLDKTAEKIFPKDNIPGKAWIDNSPKPFSAETNDLEWKREYLSMPFRIKDTMTVLDSMANNLAYVAENYKSHVGMVEEGHKLFKKINSRLSQKKLNEYL